MATTIQITMAVILFLAGLAMIFSGLLIIMTREYQDALRSLSSQSMRLSGKAITDIGVQPALDGIAQLLNSVTRLVQTAIGTGAFLCLLGAVICTASFWLLTLVRNL
jgi:CBS domain containing-hemolysin-like protein